MIFLQKHLTLIFFWIFFFRIISLSNPSFSPKDFNNFFINAASKAKSSVVNIGVYKRKLEGGKNSYLKIADSSGTIISKRGLVVTNYHVVLNGDFYQITDYNGSKYELQKFENGSYFLADKKTDLALLKIKLSSPVVLDPIKFADSNNLKEGEWVLAIGNPYGLKQSITGGIISSTGRDNIGFTDIEDFIQFDASLNPGNSGGPLVNLWGEMVGLNTAIKTVSGGYQGISFAIPSSITQHVCQELGKYGRVRRGWLGFLLKEKRFFSQVGEEKTGVEIISIIKKSPAELVGLKVGDLIKKVDSQEIETLSKLIKIVGQKKIGSQIKIRVSRKERLLNFELTLREKQIYKKIRAGMEDLFFLYGLEVDEKADFNEVVVSYLSPKSVEAGLKKGDVLVSINNSKIFSLEDFIGKFLKFRKKILQLKVYRENRLHNINFD